MRRAALLAATTVAVVGCGSNGPTAYSVVQNYVNAIGEGNYANACGLLDQRARAALRTPCQAKFARCLPNETAAFARDQTQQLYANINLSVSGSKAVATVGGTAVARTVRTVKLAQQGDNWRLTSPGYTIERCRR
jgi:hypothetical protein